MRGGDTARRDATGADARRAPAAVLVPVFRDREGELRLVLLLRGTRGIHGGQIGLPGGKPEPGDRSLLETALREAEEEVGLPRDAVEVVTALEPLETRTTGFRVHPYLARITPPRRWRPAAGEVAAVFTPTVRELVDPVSRREHELAVPGRDGALSVDGVLFGEGLLLWGLTLRLLDPVLPRLLAGEWPV